MGASLAACFVGLLGAEGGLFWVVGGVWAVRRIWGRPVGMAWGLACLAAGLRWSTTGLADIEAATRIVAPTLVAGPVLAIVGASFALAGALSEEAKGAGLQASRLPDRLVAGIALVTLVVVFMAPGPGPSVLVGAGWWLGAAALLSAVVLALRGVAASLPAWVPVALTVAGLVMIGAAR